MRDRCRPATPARVRRPSARGFFVGVAAVQGFLVGPGAAAAAAAGAACWAAGAPRRMTVSRKPLTDFKRELITPTAARSQTAVQRHKSFAVFGGSSDVRTPSQARPYQRSTWIPRFDQRGASRALGDVLAEKLRWLKCEPSSSPDLRHPGCPEVTIRRLPTCRNRAANVRVPQESGLGGTPLRADLERVTAKAAQTRPRAPSRDGRNVNMAESVEHPEDDSSTPCNNSTLRKDGLRQRHASQKGD